MAALKTNDDFSDLSKGETLLQTTILEAQYLLSLNETSPTDADTLVNLFKDFLRAESIFLEDNKDALADTARTLLWEYVEKFGLLKEIRATDGSPHLRRIVFPGNNTFIEERFGNHFDLVSRKEFKNNIPSVETFFEQGARSKEHLYDEKGLLKTENSFSKRFGRVYSETTFDEHKNAVKKIIFNVTNGDIETEQTFDKATHTIESITSYANKKFRNICYFDPKGNLEMALGQPKGFKALLTIFQKNARVEIMGEEFKALQTQFEWVKNGKAPQTPTL